MWHKTDEASSAADETPASVASNPTAIGSRVSPAPPQTAPLSAAGTTVTSNGASKINSGLKIEGEISGTTDLFIDGQVQGTIRLQGANVTVGLNGKVQADIEARAIQVEGSVRGNLRASEEICLGAHGRAQGSLISPKLGIEEGARVSGKVDMTRPGEFRNETGAPKKAAGVAIRRETMSGSEETESK